MARSKWFPRQGQTGVCAISGPKRSLAAWISASVGGRASSDIALGTITIGGCFRSRGRVDSNPAGQGGAGQDEGSPQRQSPADLLAEDDRPERNRYHGVNQGNRADQRHGYPGKEPEEGQESDHRPGNRQIEKGGERSRRHIGG